MKHETFDDLLKEDKKEKSGDDDSDDDLDIGRFRIDAKEVSKETEKEDGNTKHTFLPLSLTV